MKRPLALIGFSYFLTLVLLNYAPDSIIGFIACAFFVALIISMIIKKIREKKVFGVIFLSCLTATISYSLRSNDYINTIQNIEETDAEICGIVCDIPYKKHTTYNYILKVTKINNKEVKPFKIILKSHSALECDICDIFTGHAHISSIENDISQNYKMYCKSRNIYAQAFFYSYMDNLIETPQQKSFLYYILSTRQNFSSNLRKIFQNKISSVTNALFLGEKNTIPYEIRLNFEKIGIYHLLTTSGIHVSIFVQIILWILKKIKLNKKASCVIAAILTFFLEIFVGFTPSVTKSGTIMILYLLGIVISRQADTLNSLGLSILIMCLINPNFACSIGLIMSVFSTLGIIYLYNPIKSKIKFITKSILLNKILNYITSSISLTLSVTLFTLPLCVIYYGKFSLISIISNVIIYPLVIFLIFFAAFINFLFIFNFPHFLIELPAYIAESLAKIIIKLSEIFSKIPFAYLDTNYGVFRLCLLCILIIFSAAIYLENSNKNFKIATLVSINLIFISIFSYQLQERNSTYISLIPCNDGLSVVLSKSTKQAAFIQLKEKTNVENIQNYFSNCSISSLDYLYISSTDSTKKYIVKNMVKTYNPKIVVMPDGDLMAQENLFENLNSKTVPIYFKNKIISKFWDEISSEIIEQDSKIYIKINLYNNNIVIIPTGGNINNLPENWKNCDFLILSGIPLNYKKIKSNNIFLSTNETSSKIGIYKLATNHPKIYSLLHQGILNIKLNSNGNYNIWRLK